MRWEVDGFVASLTGSAPATVSAYRSDLVDFTTWAERSGIEGPGSVDRRTLRRYLVHLAERPVAPRTLARRASSLRRYFGWQVRSGRLAVDPTIGLHAPRGTGRLPAVLHDDQLHQLLDAPPARAALDEGRDGPADPVDRARFLRDQACLELLYGSGLRVSELCGLRLGDCDLAEARVRVWGKGSKQRIVPMSEPSIAAVRVYLADGRPLLASAGKVGDLLFANLRGNPLTPRRATAPRSPGARAHPPARCATPSPPTCSTGSGPPQRAGAAGPRGPGHHADLHARQPGAAARRLRSDPPRA
ncbi:MAG: tyrosine-type recombinase/integrase [Acidimicrobiales bacterium]